MKIKERTMDLTQGIVWKQLLIFSLPILAGSLFQQLYTTVDAVIIGKFAGKEGLAAIDSVYNLLRLPVNFFVGLSTGATIMISQYFGSKNHRELSKAVHTAVAFAFVGGGVLSAAGIFFAPFFLKMLEVPEELFPATLSYVRIYFGGLAVSMVYNIGAGILRAAGNSKTPLYYLVLSSTVNVVLDLLFVAGLKWGVAGTALGTVLSQALSAILIVRALMNTELEYRLVLKYMKFHPMVLKSIFTIGLPIALQSSLYPIANMMIQANINSMGTDNIAAWALCGKLDFPVWLVIDALAASVATFAAQNFGAGKYSRMHKGIRTGLGTALGIVIAISAVLFFWSEPLGQLFINKADYDILLRTGRLMRFFAPFYFLSVFGEVLSGGIHATGETVKPMILTLLGTCVCRILWVLLIVPGNPVMFTVLVGYPVSWFVTAVFFIIFYSRRKKKVENSLKNATINSYVKIKGVISDTDKRY